MKVVRTSNYNIESEAERLIAENISEVDAIAMRDKLRNDPKRSSFDWFEVKPDSYRLWRGMADIVGDD